MKTTSGRLSCLALLLLATSAARRPKNAKVVNACTVIVVGTFIPSPDPNAKCNANVDPDVLMKQCVTFTASTDKLRNLYDCGAVAAAGVKASEYLSNPTGALATLQLHPVGSLSVAGDLGVTVLAPDLTCACQALVDGTVWGRNTPSYDIGWVNFGGVTRVSDPERGSLFSVGASSGKLALNKPQTVWVHPSPPGTGFRPSGAGIRVIYITPDETKGYLLYTPEVVLEDKKVSGYNLLSEADAAFYYPVKS